MKYESKSSVICLGDTRQAALYFDRVVIVDPAEQMGVFGLPGTGDGAYSLLFNKTASEQELLNYNYLFQEYRKAVDLPGFSFTRDSASGDFVSNTRRPLIEGYINDSTLANGNNVREALKSFTSQLGIDKYSVLLPPPQIDSPDAYDNDENPCLTLSNIQLIDTDKTSWEQIFELRKDTASANKLRNLKLFGPRQCSRISHATV